MMTWQILTTSINIWSKLTSFKTNQKKLIESKWRARAKLATSTSEAQKRLEDLIKKLTFLLGANQSFFEVSLSQGPSIRLFFWIKFWIFLVRRNLKGFRFFNHHDRVRCHRDGQFKNLRDWDSKNIEKTENWLKTAHQWNSAHKELKDSQKKFLKNSFNLTIPDPVVE